MRYNYSVIANQIGNKGGRGVMKTPHAITTHHSAVVRNGTEDGVGIAKAYCRYHGGYMPYHFLITRKATDPIYCTQWVTQYTWHNSNGTGNKDCIAVCVDGNFQTQDPSSAQLEKLQQLFDDLYNNWFSKSGWTSFDKYINPRDKYIHTYSDNKKVRSAHWHNEVAQVGHGTACCGSNLMPYVTRYRDKGYITLDQEAMYKEKYTKLKKDYDALVVANKKLKADVISIRKENTKLNADIISIRGSVKDLEEKVKNQTDMINTKDAKIGELKVKNEKLTKDLQKCKESKPGDSLWNRVTNWVSEFFD